MSEIRGDSTAAVRSVQPRGGGAIPASPLHNLALPLHDYVQAHQRKIREILLRSEPAEECRSLNGYSIEIISREQATPLILKYEWLGNVGRAKHFIGLFSRTRKLHGAVCFGYGPAGKIRDRIGNPAWCLERGACIHYAPPNAASYLISGACRLIFRLTSVPLFFAYADPMAGEYGGVYQACNWVYLGQGLDGSRGRSRRFFILPPGGNPDNAAEWRTTRDLRREGNRMTFNDARALGYTIAMRDAKHVYAINIGRDRKKWRKLHLSRPYPSPRPELKIRSSVV